MISSKGSVVVGEQGAGGAWLLGGLVVPDRGDEGEESLQDAGGDAIQAIKVTREFGPTRRVERSAPSIAQGQQTR